MTLIYTDEQLLQILRDLAAELGRSPTTQELQDRRDLPSPDTYRARFGSWTAALEAIGREPHRPRIFSDEQLLQILRDLAAELGCTPTINALQIRAGLPSHVTYANRFGSWTSALKAAGLEPYRLRPTFSKEQLLQILRDMAAQLGYPPTTYEIQIRQDLPSSGAYNRYFKTWEAALKAAGLTPGRRPSAHTEEQLLQTLRDLAAELGRSPTQRELQARDDLPSISAYCKHFGGWNAALEAAGLKLNRVKKTKRRDAKAK